ncbi:prepilin-type N-terminal cleavage/methylation domain-containing protein [Photobacterium sp. WH77]|uniref:prepilin-type N-terminal cleavage/methylation domain-containing protein n=1 Tax=unclassified Photobacterium TaxID=2628852 RepID=UPI001EDB3DDB|nr:MULTISPECIES: prepilin-type N-terminal cleavage/methylation domain-containing protein [unclassified Photobacterium]MCG2835586.1 prepilin-type N-terminal cleavage/methylation domain-containing protein [Photobacterium sp. WH77]MCG2843199.1 prepilin-type N-terminal cleavage/methylation domain-containing protein [Photobacterium sp. WH80]MDO6580929.1 prepilin-type N-terminal cleavage/methylation domain-containing protein [Photobacterium sp. 2_MG-2023]
MSDAIKPVADKQRGFSLVEVLVSLLLVSVGLAGLMKLHAYLNLQVDNALVMLTAVNLAESHLEHLHLESLHLASLRADPQPGQHTHTEQHALHSVTILLEAVVGHDTQPGGISTVTVQASWQDRWHREHQVTLETRMLLALH